MVFTSPKLNHDLVVKILKEYNAKPPSDFRKELNAACSADDPATAIAGVFKKYKYDGLGEAEFNEIISYHGSDTPNNNEKTSSTPDPTTEKKKDDIAKISITIFAGVYNITTKSAAVTEKSLAVTQEGKITLGKTTYDVTSTRDTNGDTWCVWGDANATSFKVKFFTTTKNKEAVWGFEGHRLVKKTGSAEPDKEEFKGEKQPLDPDDKKATKGWFDQYGQWIVTAGAVMFIWYYFKRWKASDEAAQKEQDKKKKEESEKLRDEAAKAMIELRNDVRGLASAGRQWSIDTTIQRGMNEQEKKALLDDLKKIVQDKYEAFVKRLPADQQNRSLELHEAERLFSEIRGDVKQKLTDVFHVNVTGPTSRFVQDMVDLGLMPSHDVDAEANAFTEETAEFWSNNVCSDEGSLRPIFQAKFLTLEKGRLQAVKDQQKKDAVDAAERNVEETAKIEAEIKKIEQKTADEAERKKDVEKKTEEKNRKEVEMVELKSKSEKEAEEISKDVENTEKREEENKTKERDALDIFGGHAI